MHQIGDYKLIDTIGQGGMGTVYLGESLATGEKVAVKVVRSGLSAKSSVSARFRHEIDISKQFSHPFVIKVLDGGFLPDETLYLVMEFLQGESLREVIEEARLATSQGWRIMLHMADALSYVHQKGVIHRDIKPDNILVASKDRTVLLDFGLALMDEHTRLSATSDRPGTWLTMSPEQLSGKAIDGRSDIYSLGVTMYCALTGKKPFSTPDIVRVCSGLPAKVPPPVFKVNPSIDKALSAIVMKCMAVNPSDRFSSAEELHQILQKGPQAYDFRGNVTVESRPSIEPVGKKKRPPKGSSKTGARGALASSSTNTSAITSSPSSVRSSIRGKGDSQRRIKAAVAVVFFLIACFAGFLLKADKEEPVAFLSSSGTITATTAEVMIKTPLEVLSHMHLWADSSPNKLALHFDETVSDETVSDETVSDETVSDKTVSEKTPFRAVFKDLMPDTQYHYVMYGKGTQKSLEKSFKTPPLIKSINVSRISATAVDIEIEPSFEGSGQVQVTIFPVVNGVKQTHPWSTIKRDVVFSHKEKSMVYVKRLKSETDYVGEFQIRCQELLPDVVYTDTRFFETPGTNEIELVRIGSEQIQKPSISEILAGKGYAWGNTIEASSAPGAIDGKFAYSGHNYGVYLMDMKTRKVAHKVLTPGRDNQAMVTLGNRLYTLETPAKDPSGKEGSECFIKVYDFHRLTLEKTISVGSQCLRNFLRVYGDCAVICTSRSRGQLIGYSTETGKILWKSRHRVDPSFACVDSRGYLWIKSLVMDGHGAEDETDPLIQGVAHISSYHMKTGNIAALVQLNSLLSYDPVEVNGLILLPFDNGRLQILNSRTSATVTVLNVVNPVKCACPLGNKVYFVGSSRNAENIMGTGSEPGRFFVVDFGDPLNIRETLSRPVENARSSPGKSIISDGYFYYGTPMLGFNCIDIENGNHLYTHKAVMISGFYQYPDDRGLFYCHVGGIVRYVEDK